MEEDNQEPDPARERWRHRIRIAVTAVGFGIGLWLFGWLAGGEGGRFFVGFGQTLVSLGLCCTGILFFFVPQDHR